MAALVTAISVLTLSRDDQVDNFLLLDRSGKSQ